MARRPARTIAHPFPAPIIRGSLREEEVKEFARQTPPEVANWLRLHLAATPGHPVLRALACDNRMSSLWAELTHWQPRLWIVQLAVRFSTPAFLSTMQRPPQERTTLGLPEDLLGEAAADFAILLGWWENTAAELWGGPIEPLVDRLWSFAAAALERGRAKQTLYDYIHEPSRRGRGVRKQRAFREALSRALERICEDHPLPQEKQDLIVATITSVVSPGWDVDSETIRRHRQRQASKPTTADKSRS